jgi:para-aminobenzoate synthetase component 1
MIVDLLRNDLSKVCEDHSIEVTKLCDIESFEGLHHMVSTVRGTLRGDQDAMQALRACFPGGSITGAPKIRAMEIIEELETHRRGAYCGALAWMGYDGAMDSAITIRTLLYEHGQVHLQTGGGITAVSEPEAELAETLTKADKILQSFAPLPKREAA